MSEQSSLNIRLDEIDLQLLRELQKDARLPNAELARRIPLSPPAVHARLRRLETQQVIQQYTARLNYEQLGYDLSCFIGVILQTHQLRLVQNFRTAVAQFPEVAECYHLAGEYDYLLKVILKNRQHLEQFITEKLTPLEGINRLQISVVLTEIKSQTSLF
jgi:Lrp/AsnC family transcriptional regulator, leucine-responsive regulatory protein